MEQRRRYNRRAANNPAINKIAVNRNQSCINDDCARGNGLRSNGISCRCGCSTRSQMREICSIGRETGCNTFSSSLGFPCASVMRQDVGRIGLPSNCEVVFDEQMTRTPKRQKPSRRRKDDHAIKHKRSDCGRSDQSSSHHAKHKIKEPVAQNLAEIDVSREMPQVQQRQQKEEV